MKPVRSILSSEAKNEIFLTFDDGPDDFTTPKVLDLLAEQRAKATFFVIAQKASSSRSLLRRIRDEGHSIGNHSLDHEYRHFFGGKKKILEWVSESEMRISDLIGAPTVGFRPPAGVHTPELRSSLSTLRMPMILWNIRFYDAVFSWSPSRADRSLKWMSEGSIILLHDRQKLEKRKLFLATLSGYIQGIQNRGFVLKGLNQTSCLRTAERT